MSQYARFCKACGHELDKPPPAARTSTPAPALPRSFASGRYKVKSLLGEGGKKRVYLATDTRLERDVAVAVIKTEGLDEPGLKRIQREAQAMGRLGDHPNIVTIHDVGDDISPGSGQAPQPYIVSQYMAGGDVEHMEFPLPIERTLEIAKDIARGLAHAHANGVVHRDIKPGNIWLAEDGTASLGDFGLAVAAERSRLTMAGMLMGTVAYMPPEQALGGEVTPQSDLYSLGCLLYELVTGRPPFVGDDPTGVISQHINTSPVAPSWQTEDCPPDLEELIVRLLAKDPGERPDGAAAVLEAIERVDPTEKSASHSDSNVLDRLALGVFVGREKEMERLRQALDATFAGRGGLVMLVGEPGIGKTRTTQELETYARVRGAQVLWGRTHEAAGAPAYWPWLQAGNQYAGMHADEMTELIGPQMPPGAVSELSRIFPWLRDAPDFVEPEEIDDPEVAQFKLFDAYTSYLRAIANQAPLVVALDDLHWADKPTLLMLQHIARELSRMRVLIVANYRDTDITRQSSLSETLAALNRESGFERIVLRGLTRDEVANYVTAKANVTPRPDVLDRIYEETEGNAFFLSEVVNLMAQEGTLTNDSVSDIAIPDGVREALGRRLNRLSEEANEFLQVAAIIGRDFTYDTLQLLGERDEDELLRLIEEALEARVIEETEQAGRYRFMHAQMQETLLDELSTTRRVRLHGRVGEALEQRYGARADERAARLAFHFVEAATLAPRHAEKAVRYSTLAGEQAAAQSGYGDAARHYRAALSIRERDEIDDEMADLLYRLSMAASATLQVSEAWRSARQAFDYYANAGNVAKAVDVAYFAGTNQGFIRPSQTQLIERALELVKENSEDFGRLSVALGFSAGMLGDEQRAQEAFARADDVAQRLGLKRLELDGLLFGLQVSLFHMHSDAAAEMAERAVALARELDLPRGQYTAHFFAAVSLRWAGDEEAGRRHADACRELAERLRDLSAIADATHVQAASAIEGGDWESARTFLTRGLEIAPRDIRLLSHAALIASVEGDSSSASDYVDRMLETMHATPPGPSLGYAFPALYLPRIALITGQPLDSDVVDHAARAVLESPVAGTPRIKAHVRLGLAIQAVLANDQSAAEGALRDLEDAGTGVRDALIHTDHIRGLLLDTLGRADEAVAACDSALDFLKDGYDPIRAEVLYDSARIRLKRAAPSDYEQALALNNQALDLAQKLGMKPLIERIIATKLKLQGVASGDIKTSIDAVAATVQSEQPDLRSHAAPDGTVTILFSDIESHTAINERLGDQRWMELLREHNAMVREQIQSHDGYEVKTEGDGFMIAFGSARKAVQCAIAIQRAFAKRNDDAGEPVLVRIGLHTGEPVQENNDFYGTQVTQAARIANEASGGEILVSALLKELTDAGGDIDFSEAREVELKGLGSQRVYAVGW